MPTGKGKQGKQSPQRQGANRRMEITTLVVAALVVAAIWIGFRMVQSRSASVVNTSPSVGPSTAASAAAPAAAAPIKAKLTPAQYQADFVKAKQPHLLVDVRTPGEFASGHIPGAVNIDVQQLSQRLNEIPKDQTVVLYCRSGNRSATAANMLARAGYPVVYDLGGIITWQAQGLPVQ